MTTSVEGALLTANSAEPDADDLETDGEEELAKPVGLQPKESLDFLFFAMDGGEGTDSGKGDGEERTSGFAASLTGRKF